MVRNAIRDSRAGTSVGGARKVRVSKSQLKRARNLLLAAAVRRRTVTYGELMKKFKLSRGRVLSELIEAVDRRENASGAPGFAAIVVRKDTGYPGGGYFCDQDLPVSLRRPRNRGTDPRLSPAERRHVRGQQEKIWTHYGKPRTENR